MEEGLSVRGRRFWRKRKSGKKPEHAGSKAKEKGVDASCPRHRKRENYRPEDLEEQKKPAKKFTNLRNYPVVLILSQTRGGEGFQFHPVKELPSFERTSR